MEKELKEMISCLGKRPVSCLTPATSLKADLNLDNLDLFLLSLKLEERFGIVVADEHFERFTTLGSVADYILEEVDKVTIACHLH